MIIVTVFGFAVLHTAATKCIAGDCMLDASSRKNSEDNLHFVNYMNESKVFGRGFYDDLNKIIQEMAISNANYNNYQITDSIDELHNFLNYSIPCGIRRRRLRPRFVSNRVVGGSNSSPGEFPWQISLQLITGRTARHICGGSVISETWILTAAHCVYGLSEDLLSVVAGKNNLYASESYGQRVKVIGIYFNGFNKDKLSKDIALLKVFPSLIFDGSRVSPICIPKPGTRFDSAIAMVTGWGRVSENGVFAHILQKVQLPLMPLDTCLDVYKNSGYGDLINRCVVCGGGSSINVADSCQGDSGGPLSCLADDNRFYLCGIVSWGLGCARPDYPGVYTAVSCYANWIRYSMRFE
ncbi:Serine proteases, trypsin family, serine active site,Peptidase S1, PA clan,Serine proteases, trypsin [Cinara cedri]|uniref:Serine proteases, trypsin family, serine active site,Peptidase S1, PA clan,Serine proteases, trypsin n=1 Tax=Cinara cedri TaxID=506608 RepID=A0A5E4M0X2_9HEMI|nr:Serine proteases, trypsin family, serine active site,Peptidase S1, PA clan,Serine proteases, trypsin [Cinara cedri]